MANTESAIGCGHPEVHTFCSPSLGEGTEIHCQLGTSFEGEGVESWGIPVFQRGLCSLDTHLSFQLYCFHKKYILCSTLCGTAEIDHPPA